LSAEARAHLHGAARPGTLVVGIGNTDRGDDAVGVVAVQRLLARWGGAAPRGVLVRTCEGDPLGLVDGWRDARQLVLVDATAPAGAPGTVRRLTSIDALRSAAPSSSHGLGLAEAIALAASLGTLPSTWVVIGVEARSFAHGAALTPEVAAGVPRAVAAVEREVLARP